jgi:hypothetical protein
MKNEKLLEAMKVAAPHKESCRSIKVLSAH